MFGAHVTLANKFESTSEPQRIHISPTTYEYVFQSIDIEQVPHSYNFIVCLLRRLLSQEPGFVYTRRDPSCLPKECPADMVRLSHFLDDYKNPSIDKNSPLNVHIDQRLEEIGKAMTLKAN